MATEDRLSDLPESILLDILSLLPDKREVVRTSVLSKQWRFLWKSVPISLYFSPDQCDSSDQDIVDFVASTNRELHYWRSFQIIYRVTIFFPYEERYAKDVDLWVYFSTQVANVQEFALGFNYLSNYEFPKFAYKSTSLRIMLLCNCILNPSGSVNWNSLVKLCISNLNLKEAVLEKILAGCPNLEWLNMNTVWGIHHLEINSHKLRKLIINDYIIEESHVKNSQLLDILAPNIENFQFLESCHETHLSLRNMASLITANLDFKTFDGQYNLEEVCTNFKELLHSVAHVENLELGPWCLQILSLLELQGWQFPASSWKFLKLNTALEQQDFPGIFRLLQSSSDLETMVIEQEKQNPRQQSGSRFTNENKDSRRHMKDYYNYSLLQLKTIKIIYFHGPQSANLFALPLVKYLLKNATVLEKLVVAARFEGSDVSQDYVEMEQEIRSFPRSSPYASVVFSYSEHESVTYLVEWTYH